MRILLFNLLATLSIPTIGQSIVSSGTIEIPGTYHFSFDKGLVVSGDVIWRQTNSSVRHLMVEPGARIVNLGPVNFADLKLDQLDGLTYRSQRIEGSDGSNELVVGDVFAVRTKGRNYAKAIVTGVFDPKQNNGLILEWVTYASSSPAGARTVSSGTVEIPGNGQFSFDTGATGDVWWEQQSKVSRYLLSDGMTQITNLGSVNFGNLTLAELQKLDYENASSDIFADLATFEKLSYGDARSNKISGGDGENALAIGDVFAVHTNAGNYAKAMVISEFDPKQNHGLILRWVTYASK